MNDSDLAVLDALWDEVKRDEVTAGERVAGERTTGEA
jgi:hypothetical protein